MSTDPRTGAPLDDSDPGSTKAPFPQEPRENAQKRAALLWRMLSENRPERDVAVFTHSKMVKEDHRAGHSVLLLGPGIRDFKNGEHAIVVFGD
jgi:hypothetical protein